ncbi:MAG: hypothetical protein V4653_03410 [Pseudomonadota bacterium]
MTRPPRHWIKRPPRPSRPPPPPAPVPQHGRRLSITIAAGLGVGLVAAYVAANMHPDPSLTWAALGFGAALAAALAWRMQG